MSISLCSAALPHTNAHTDQPIAAMMPREMSVSIVVVRWRAFIAAARWNGPADHTTTGNENASAHHFHPSNCSAENIDIATTGIPATSDTVSRVRSIATRSSVSLSSISGVVSSTRRAP